MQGTTDPSRETRALRLLVVEDHDDTRRLTAMLLERSGHLVTTAESVESGLRAADAGEFDWLICDLGLPDASGLVLMRELKTRKAMKGIALTGSDDADDIRDCREAGFTEHLIKPLDFDRLEQILAV